MTNLTLPIAGMLAGAIFFGTGMFAGSVIVKEAHSRSMALNKRLNEMEARLITVEHLTRELQNR